MFFYLTGILFASGAEYERAGVEVAASLHAHGEWRAAGQSGTG